VHNTELQALSEKAEAADKEARKELRRLVRDSSPEVIGRLADIGRRAGRICWPGMRPVVTLSPTEEALYAKLDAMRMEIAGENPTPLELLLLTERIVSLWMLTALLEVLVGAQYRKTLSEGTRRSSPSYLIQQSRILEGATRRYLAAIRELARVRKLQAGAPPVRVNAQVNKATGILGADS
jgi:hypothetical protein